MRLFFSIFLHQKDYEILEKIKSYLGVGQVLKQGSDVVSYKIQSMKDLSILMDHLERYPLITKKYSDYVSQNSDEYSDDILDSEGNVIAFSGSLNESANALQNNYEAIDVFCSWNDSDKRVENKKNDFEKIWQGCDSNLLVITLLDKLFKEGIINFPTYEKARKEIEV